MSWCFSIKNAILRCNSTAKSKLKEKPLLYLRTDLFLRVCRTASVVLELDYGLLAFFVVSPLAGAGGRSALKTAFTSVSLVNL